MHFSASHTCVISHPLWFDCLNNTWWWVQITKLLTRAVAIEWCFGCVAPGPPNLRAPFVVSKRVRFLNRSSKIIYENPGVELKKKINQVKLYTKIRAWGPKKKLSTPRYHCTALLLVCFTQSFCSFLSILLSTMKLVSHREGRTQIENVWQQDTLTWKYPALRDSNWLHCEVKEVQNVTASLTWSEKGISAGL
jgi:hypothetical protein